MSTAQGRPQQEWERGGGYHDRNMSLRSKIKCHRSNIKNCRHGIRLISQAPRLDVAVFFPIEIDDIRRRDNVDRTRNKVPVPCEGNGLKGCNEWESVFYAR